MISDLTNDFFIKRDDFPFVKTRPKSLSSLIGKVHRKLDDGDKNVKNYVSEENLIENLFSNKSGISDLVGLRMIFLRFPNIEPIRVDFITNFLVGEHGFKTAVMDDRKSGGTGYKAIHFKLQFPEKYASINLEIQCMGIVQHLWMESEHNLLYKQEKSLSDEQMKYMKELYSHLSGVLEEIESILFLAWE
ncbi:MAG: RelA/SpoT domain-containing protein [Cuniculiplasma sp.]